jgi:DNA-binding transcriptional regulator YdaS (Cro superfamily)
VVFGYISAAKVSQHLRQGYYILAISKKYVNQAGKQVVQMYPENYSAIASQYE